jgi:hypothetical protein
MSTRRKNPQKRHHAAAERRDHISPERRAGLAGPVGVVERMELEAVPPDQWLARVLSNPNIGADAKAYAEHLAAQWREHGCIPEELFQ